MRAQGETDFFPFHPVTFYHYLPHNLSLFFSYNNKNNHRLLSEKII